MTHAKTVDEAGTSAHASTRDRFPDLLRSLALGAVILGHWTMGAISVTQDGLHVGNVLNVNRHLWPLTWLLVLIPLFFFVGGFSNATSLSRAAQRGKTGAQWVGARLKSLLLPVLPFLLIVLALVGVALAAGVRTELVLTVAVVVLMPLWFVAVYAVLAVLTPLMWGLHKRFGIWVVVGLVVLACLTDTVRTVVDEPLIGYLNYVFVHGTMQQFGFFYFDGRLQKVARGRGAGWLVAWAVGAFAVLCAVVATPVWAASMVGMSGERSNMNPPSIPSLLHGLVLIPLVMLAYPWLKSRIDRPRVARVLDIAAANSMRAFLWHLPVMVTIVALAYAVDQLLGGGITGGGAVGAAGGGTGGGSAGESARGSLFVEPGSAAWWFQRPLWIAAYALGLWGMLKMLGRRASR